MGRNYSDFKGDKNPNIKNGLYAKGSPFAGIKNSWQNMKQRCTNPKHPKFHRYGGRGIRVCDEWLDIDVFYKWSIANGWEKGFSIDRIVKMIKQEMPENIWAGDIDSGSNHVPARTHQHESNIWHTEYILKSEYDALKEKCEHQQKVIDAVRVVEKDWKVRGDEK
jgi:hypothetical protein